MNKDEINRAIEEFCGTDRWVLLKRGLYYRPNAKGYTYNLSEAWILTEKEADEHTYPHDEPVTKKRAPARDFFNDLNAVRDAVKKLFFSKRNEYRTELQKILSRGLMSGGIVHMSECIDASAPQRCEALLRTLNKWQD